MSHSETYIYVQKNIHTHISILLRDFWGELKILHISSVQLLSRVPLFATPWIAALHICMYTHTDTQTHTHTDTHTHTHTHTHMLPRCNESIHNYFSVVLNPSTMQETWVRSLGWEDPLEKEMATHPSVLTWRTPMDRGAWRATVHRITKSLCIYTQTIELPLSSPG